eukprot:764221-Ditylum_brightwellii.AAC.1
MASFGGRGGHRGGRNTRGGGGRNSRGGGGGRGGGAGLEGGPPPRLRPCRNFVTTGSCVNASTCGFAHVVKMHASIDASSRSSKPSHHRYNQPNTSHEPVSSVAIWETQGTIKIFSGSHDGYWRLWNTAQGTFVKEFEHRMGGKVETVDVASNFLFVGFEGTTVKVPGVRVGMVHAWNLAVPTDPPI